MRKLIVIMLLAASGLLLFIFSRPSSGHVHGPSCSHEEPKKTCGGHDHDDGAGGVELTPAQREAIGLKMSTASATPLERRVRLNGELRFNTERMAEVMPRMPGFAVASTKQVGDHVREGEVLAVLESHKLGELHADFFSSREKLTLHEAEFRRQEKLMRSKATSEQNLLNARQDHAQSLAELHRSEANLWSLGIDPASLANGCGEHLKRCTTLEMRSPIAGTVIRKDIKLGETFAEDNSKVCFVIADLGTVWLDLMAYQNQLPLLKKGMKVGIDLGHGGKREAVLSYVAPFIDAANRTALVRAVLDNPDGTLRPGMFATADVAVPTPQNFPVVEKQAVRMLDGEQVIFIPAGHGFRAVPVKTGEGDGERVEILSGLKVGDSYVSAGAFELKAALVTGGLDPHAGHGH